MKTKQSDLSRNKNVCGLSSTFVLLIFVLLSLITPHDSLYAQKQVPPAIAHSILGLAEEIDEGTILFFYRGDSIVETTYFHPNAPSRVIVQFSSPPLAPIKSTEKASSEGFMLNMQLQIQQEQDAFLAKLQELEAVSKLDSNQKILPAKTDIHHRYQMVLNGMALTAPQWVVDEIRHWPEVKQIEEDGMVWTSLRESLSVMYVDTIWSRYGVSGEGIVVGIMDTGIDYMHPDLGGGIGPGYKVLGGHDFTSDDPDPMDYNGHGTHVAGIVAADGALKGVAPGAQLMGYKVLNDEGIGLHSWIIAGFEQAVLDGVNIVNVSLGGEGHPDDLLSQAADNTSAAGVICVIAAGNNGPGYHSVDSPGAARSVITVGAYDKDNNIAEFSSRGPTNKPQIIKPEVLAPGVDIYAPIPGGDYATLSGTSMATPHVAGAVALMLEKFPGLSPARMKSILLHTASDLGLDLFTQGAGQIDLLRAFEPPSLFIYPPMLSFGSSDIHLQQWSKTDTLYVTNDSDNSKSLSFELQNTLPEGASVSVLPASLTLLPGETQKVSVTLTVDNERIRVFGNDYPGYLETIHVLGDEHNISIPISFFKNHLLSLTLDDDIELIYLFPHGGRPKNFWWPGDELEIEIYNPGLYDITVLYDGYKTMVFHEAIEINNNITLDINREQAKNHIQLFTRDEQGEHLVPHVGTEIIMTSYLDAGWGMLIPYYGQDHFFSERYFSDIKSHYWFWQGTWSRLDYSKNYLFSGSLFPCDSDVSFDYEPGDMAYFRTSAPLLNEDMDVIGLPMFGTLFFEFLPESIATLSYPFQQEYYISPFFKIDAGNSFYKELYEYTGGDFERNRDSLLIESPAYSLNENGQLLLKRTRHNPLDLSIYDDVALFEFSEVTLGLGPPHWNGLLWYDGSSSVTIDALDYLFLSQTKEWIPYSNYPFRIYHDGLLVNSGDLLEEFMIFHYPHGGRINMHFNDCDLFCVEIDHDNYHILDREGVATARIFIDSTEDTPGHTPQLKLFNIVSENQITNLLNTGQDNKIRFSLTFDDDTTRHEAREVTLAYRHEDQPVWTYLPVESCNNDRHTVTVSDQMPEGYISLKLTASDAHGKKLEYHLNPAFYKSGRTYETPSAYSLSGGGSYCEGQLPTGLSVWLDHSELYVEYALYNNGGQVGAMLPGNDQALVWENLEAGEYYVKAFNGKDFFLMHDTISLVMLPLQEVSVSISADQEEVCLGTPVELSATSVHPGENPHYQWLVNSEPAGEDSPQFVFVPEDGDQVRIILTSDAVCASGSPATSDTLIMKVHALPEVSWEMSDSDFLCVDWEPLLLTGGIPTGGVYSGNGVNNNYFDPGSVAPGVHSLVYTYENEYGCINTASLAVVVDPCTGYSPLAEVSGQLILYPNPATSELWVAFDKQSQSEALVRLYNLQGQILMERAVNDVGRIRISLSMRNIKTGVYLVGIVSEESFPVKMIVISK